MNTLTICRGRDRSGKDEDFTDMTLKRGELIVIVGNTGSGKTRLIRDIEQLTTGESITSRTILIDGKPVPPQEKHEMAVGLIAHLGQNMKFVLDISVEEFIALHSECRQKDVDPLSFLNTVNSITLEPVKGECNLSQLSGGQTRALMIADMAIICDSPIVLIDEIENAGIDKKKVMDLLLGHDKLVLAVTHDPHTALMATRRIIMEGGGIKGIINRNAREEEIYLKLDEIYRESQRHQKILKNGGNLE